MRAKDFRLWSAMSRQKPSSTRAEWSRVARYPGRKNPARKAIADVGAISLTAPLLPWFENA
jgi:hypothetical protein